MACKVVIEDERIWEKDCSKISPEHLRKIVVAVRKLEKEPWDANIQVKRLTDYGHADFRLKVSDYRVLFDKDEEQKCIRLFRVRHRSKLY